MKNVNLIAGLNAASQEELTRIIEKDIPTLTKNAESFKEANSDAYNILINTWLWLIGDNASDFAMQSVKQAMLENGLVNVIASAASSNDEFIRTQGVSDKLWSVVLEEVRGKNGYRDFGYGFAHPNREITPEIFKVFNQITKYPKRFTPLKAELFEDSTWEAYIGNQLMMSMQWTAKDTPGRAMVLDTVRDVIRILVPWDTICERCEEILKTPEILPLTPGATASTTRKMLEKIRKVERFQTDPCEIRTKLGGPFDGRLDEMQNYNKALIVPKNYKTGRVIAPEEFERASKGLAMYRVIEPVLPSNIKIRDQRFNQVLSLLGSYNESSFDTWDLSYASDSQTFMLLNELYPPKFVEIITPILATETRFPRPVIYKDSETGVQRKFTKLHASTALAMGHPLTFILECLTFLGCAVAGALYSGEDMFSRKEIEAVQNYELPNNGGMVILPRILIVGDDIGIDSRYSDATAYVLETLGFQVNTSKSFTGSHPFRESCGKEYFKGYDVTPNYYPRSPIGSLDNATTGVLFWDFNLKQGKSQPTDSLSKLVEIQHRMAIWSYHANQYIIAIIKLLCPEMTESAIGSNENDIWVTNPIIKKSYSPYGYITEFYTQDNPRAKRKYIPRSEVITTVTEEKVLSARATAAESSMATALSLYRQVLGNLTFEEAKLTQYAWVAHRLEECIQVYTLELNNSPVHRIEEYTTATGQKVFKDVKSHLVPMERIEESYMEVHTTPLVTWQTDYVLTPRDEVALTNFCYSSWLQHGPQYRSSDDTLEGIIERNCGITYNPYRTTAGAFRKLLYGDCHLIWKTK